MLLNHLNKYFKIYLFIILCLAVFNLFFNLDKQPVLNWDEARHGVTAYEMVKSNNWILTTYQGNPDYWNLKPPLGIWLIALSYKIFGFSSFALRFPSALSALLCIILVIYLALIKFDKPSALLSGLILSTAFVFIEVHSARTGDFDAQLSLIILLSVIFLDKMKKNTSYIFLAALMASIAFLLKSFACVMIIGIIAFDWLINKKYEKMKIYHYLLSLSIFILPVTLWIFARYNSDHFNFLEKMISYDLISRGNNSLEGHAVSNFYYLEPLILKFLPWSLFMILFIFYKNKIGGEIKDNIVFKIRFNQFYSNFLFLIWIIVPLITVLIIRTKCEWYLNPVYPPISIFIAWHLIDLLKSDLKSCIVFSRIKKNFSAILIFMIIISEAAILIPNISPEAALLLNERAEKHIFTEEIDEENILKNLDLSKAKVNEIDALDWTQSKTFIATVVKGLKPIEINNYTNFLTNSFNKVLLLKNNIENIAMVEKNGLTLMQSNRNWMIIKSN